MPSKRPSPLSDSIFRDKVQQQASKPHGAEQGGAGDEIPVINTFIQFGEANARSNEKSMATAPAWIGPSLQSIMAAASAQPAVQERLESGPATLPQGVLVAGSEDGGFPSAAASLLQQQQQQQPVASLSELPSPKKVPVMRYNLSSSSARAAGYSDGGPGAVVTGGSASGGCSEASPSEAPTFSEAPRAQADREGEEDADEDDDDDENQQQQPSGFVDERALAMAEAGEIPSAGSIRHAEGQCKRCCFFPKGRCLNGHKCEFCHYEHEKRKRKKKKKSKGGGADIGSGSDGEQAGASLAAVFDAAGAEQLGIAPLPRTGLPLTAPPPLPPRLPAPAVPPPQEAAHLPPPPVAGAPPPNYRGHPVAVGGHPMAAVPPYGYTDPYGYATDALGRPLAAAGYHDPHIWSQHSLYGAGLYESPYAPQPMAPLPPHYAPPGAQPVVDPAHYGLYAAPGWPPAPPHVPPPGPPCSAPATSAVTSGFAPVVGQDGRALPPPR